MNSSQVELRKSSQLEGLKPICQMVGLVGRRLAMARLTAVKSRRTNDHIYAPEAATLLLGS